VTVMSLEQPRLTAALVSLARGLLEAVFPPVCAACRAVGREPFCRVCAEALAPAGPLSIPGAEAARALLEYGGPAAAAVQSLKYGGHPEHGRSLGGALAALLVELPAVEVAVPVPTTRARLVERGYNQARELIRGLPLPAAPRALVRVDRGETQVGLGRAARLANLEGAFAAGPERVAGKRVLLVDDVVTTGATAEAATAALLAAGATAVVVLALARAERAGGP